MTPTEREIMELLEVFNRYARRAPIANRLNRAELEQLVSEMFPNFLKVRRLLREEGIVSTVRGKV